MATEDGAAPHHLSHLRTAAAEVRRYGFFPLVRGVEARALDRPRVGRAATPAQNIVDMAHATSLDFPGATLDAIEFRRPGRVTVRGAFLGLTGPMGPLPTHMTELAQLEARHSPTQPYGRFLDLLTDRMLQFFYRAWADSQPLCHADRTSDDRFGAYVGFLTGAGEGPGESLALPFRWRLHYAGIFASRRSSATLTDGLRHLLGAPVHIREFTGGWRDVEREDQCRLGSPSVANTLGSGALLGRRAPIPDAAFEVTVTARDLEHYHALLPGGEAYLRACEAVNAWKPSHLAWDLVLGIDARQAPPARLGGGARLGWTSWLSPKHRPHQLTDARLPQDPSGRRAKLRPKRSPNDRHQP